MTDPKKRVRVLFFIRVCLWITALSATVYWIWYSVYLHIQGIFEPAEYAEYFRPVFYTCVIIAIASVAISFALYHYARKRG